MKEVARLLCHTEPACLFVFQLTNKRLGYRSPALTYTAHQICPTPRLLKFQQRTNLADSTVLNIPII